MENIKINTHKQSEGQLNSDRLSNGPEKIRRVRDERVCCFSILISGFKNK